MSNAILLFLGITLTIGGAQMTYLSVTSDGIDYFLLTLYYGLVLAAFVSGLLFVRPVITSGKDRFVNRFLIITTVQMLGVFGLLLSALYTIKEQRVAIIVHLAVFFLICLILQSLILVKFSRQH